MPGQRVSADKVKEIIELKSRHVSNRRIAEIVGLNRNTVNHYCQLQTKGLLGNAFKIKKSKSYHSEQRLIDCLKFIQQKFEATKLLPLWKLYKIEFNDGYRYTHFCGIAQLVERIVIMKNPTHPPILITGRLKVKSSINPAYFICLLFPASGLQTTIHTSDLKAISIINFLQTSFCTLGGYPEIMGLASSQHSFKKLPRSTIQDVEDWLDQMGSKVVHHSNENIEFKKIISQFSLDARTTNSDEEQFFGVRVSLLFKIFDRPNLSEVPIKFPELRKVITAKAQKNSHVFLPEDKNYYSIPSSYIGQVLTIKYNSEIVSIYSGDKQLCDHLRTLKHFTYTTNKHHLNPKVGWTKEYFLRVSSKIGASTKLFIQHLFEKYDSPNAGFKQANAILLLKNKYPGREIEAACSKILPIGPHTYHRLKRELELSLTFG